MIEKIPFFISPPYQVFKITCSLVFKLNTVAVSEFKPNSLKFSTLALLAVNADLARLGGLFKIALDSRSLQPELRRLLREIEKTRLEIKEKVREINDGKRH